MQRTVVGLGLGEFRTCLLRRRPVVVSVQLGSGPGGLRAHLASGLGLFLTG